MSPFTGARVSGGRRLLSCVVTVSNNCGCRCKAGQYKAPWPEVPVWYAGVSRLPCPRPRPGPDHRTRKCIVRWPAQCAPTPPVRSL
jgi:hypothetical protein